MKCLGQGMGSVSRSWIRTRTDREARQVVQRHSEDAASVVGGFAKSRYKELCRTLLAGNDVDVDDDDGDILTES